MKVAVCLITRLSNKYLREWVEYYKNLGFDKVYLYDNNREGEEVCADEIPDHVEDGFVEITRFGDAEGRVQEKAYQDCYDLHGNEYDWIAFFDDDEYLTLNTCNNIKDFLSGQIFDGRNGVAFQMINFSDNDIIVNNKKTRLDVYTKPFSYENLWYVSYYKCMTRGGLNANFLKTDLGGGLIYEECCHVPIIDNLTFNNYVDCDGNELKNNNDIEHQYNVFNAFLKHIPTGCIDDYINGKRKRGWPDNDSLMQTQKENVFGYEYFLLYNRDTIEKRMYFEANKFKH